MPNSIALIEKYMTNVIDAVFAAESKTKILEGGKKYIDLSFKEAGWVKVMSLLMDGLSDYYRVNHAPVAGSTGYAHYNANGNGTQRDGYAVGGVEATWELFKLQYDRGKQFQVDNMDNEETAAQVIANLLKEFLRVKVVPEIDAVRFSKMVGKTSASLGNYISETISANTIISKFNSAFEWLTEHEVPSEEQVIFVNPSVMTLIRNTSELYKKLSQKEYKGDVTFTIDTYEGRPIIEVPSSRFFTNVVVGANGYYAGATSYIINYMVCSTKAIVPIVKLQKSKIWTPDMVQDFDGYKVNFRLYHDVIIPKNKIAGVYASVSTTAATSANGKLSVDAKSVTGGYKVDAYYTTPAGIMGTLVHAASAFTVGSTYTITAGTTEAIEVGETFTALSQTTEYFALLDSKGQAVAVSAGITLANI